MRTKLLNKQGMKLIVSIILLIAVLCTTVISAYYIIGSRDKGAIDGGLDDSLSAVEDRKTSAPLPDGAVPTDYTSTRDWSGWTAISDKDQLRAWLGASDGTNARLTKDIPDYRSVGAGFECTTGENIETGTILDGCGFTITMTAVCPRDDMCYKRDYSSFCVNENNGTIRNVNFVKTGTVETDTGEWQTYSFGLAVGCNNGTIINTSITNGASARYELGGAQTASWSKIHAGMLVGKNNGIISNATVNIQEGAYLKILAKDKNVADGDKIAFMGGLVGWSRGTEKNITINSTATNAVFETIGESKAIGAVVGWKDEGTTYNCIIKGKMTAWNNDGSLGMVTGTADSGTFGNHGLYTTKEGGEAYNAGDSWITGNSGQASSNRNFIVIDKNAYDIAFAKSSTFYNDYATTINGSEYVAITPKNAPARSIAWKATGTGNDGANANIYESVATGTFLVKPPDALLGGQIRLAIEYGSYGSVKSITSPAACTYDGNVKFASNITYNDITNGGEKSLAINSVADSGNIYHILYQGAGYNGATNAGTYPMTTGAAYVDTANKFIVPAGSPTTQSSLVINKVKLTPSISNVTLTAGSNIKTYDGTATGHATIASNTLGIASDRGRIKLNIVEQNYSTPNAGVPNLNVKFALESGNAVNNNYEIEERYSTPAFDGVINKATFAVPNAAFTLSTSTKAYDKTTAYNGTVTVNPIKTGITLINSTEDVLILDTPTAVYTKANAFDVDNVIRVTFALAATGGANANYTLSNSSIDYAGATITKAELPITWANFSTESYYLANNKTNLTRNYDATTTISSALFVIANAFTTPLGENLKLKYVSAEFTDNANALADKPVTLTFELAQRASGTDINGTILADYRNYNLTNTTVATTASVTPAPVAVTEANFTAITTKEYDGNTAYVGTAIATPTIATGINNENLTITEISAVYSDKNVVGAKTLNITFKQTNANYAITGLTPNAGVYTASKDATITAKAITITQANIKDVVATKVYDATTAYVGTTIAQNGDIDTGVGIEKITLATMVGTYSDANVATPAKKLTVTLTQADTNYTITPSLEYDATITAKELALTAGDFAITATKVYDGGLSATVAQNAITGVGTENIALANVVGTYSDKNVATLGKMITVAFALADNAVNKNYTLAGTTLQVVGDITAKPITVTEANLSTSSKSKTYDGANTYSGTITQNGEIVTGVLAEKITLDTPITAVFNDSNVANATKLIATISQPNTNYTINGTVDITVANITAKAIDIPANTSAITYTNTKQFDNTTNYVGTFSQVADSISGIGTDKIALVFGSAVYDNINVKTATKITVNISQTNTNYSIPATVDLSATITPKELTATAAQKDEAKFVIPNVNRRYDGTTTVVINNAGTPQTINDYTYIITIVPTANYADANVGANKTITVTLTTDNDNYIFSTATKSFDWSVNGAIQDTTITVTADSFTITLTKEYDGTTTATAVSKITYPDTAELVKVNFVANYNTKEPGNNKTITISNIVPVDVGVTLSVNTVSVNTGVITKRTITLSASDFTYDNTKVYDGTTAYNGTITAKNSGVKNTGIGNDTIMITASGTPIFDNANVLSATKITFNVDMTTSNYYEIAPTLEVPATISKKAITLTADNFVVGNAGSKVYDGTVDVNVVVNGVINGVTYSSTTETITLTSLVAKFSAKNVGTTVVNITYAYANDNYNINTSVVASGAITPYQITDREITVTVTDTKTYDDTTTAIVTGSSVTLVAATGDNVTLINVVANYTDANAGTNKVINATFNVDATNSVNYEFVNNVSGVKTNGTKQATATATITAKSITVTSADITTYVNTKAFDGTTNYGGELSAIVNGNITGAQGDDIIKLTFTAGSYASANVADNTINKLTLTFSLADQNYTLTNTTVEVTAGITTMKITPTLANFTYNKVMGYNNSDVVNITVNSASPVMGAGATNITFTTLTAKYNSKDVATANAIIITMAINETNYELTTGTLTDNSSCSITPYSLKNADVTFTYTNNKAYDGTTALAGTITYVIGNLGFSEDLNALLGNITGNYDTKDYSATNKTISITYGIANNANFVLTGGATQTKTFTDGVITRVEVTPTGADFTVTKSREYTGDNKVIATHNGTLTGVNGEKILLDVTAIYTGTAGADINVGNAKNIKATYAFTEDTINNNYTLPANNFVEYNDGAITAKKITISLSDFNTTGVNKIYDSLLTANVFAVNPNGVKGETLVLTMVSANFADKNAGNGKTITITFELSNATINANYEIANVTKTLTTTGDIATANMTVTFGNINQSFRNGNTTPLNNVTATYLAGLQGSDVTPTFTVAFGSGVTFNPGVAGQYAIKATSSDTNYNVTSTATLTMAFFRMENGVYIIETIADFEAIDDEASYLTHDFKQLVDLDVNFAKLNGVKGIYSGTYDGNGKKIMNAFLFDGSLFEQVSGTVKNLALVNTSINNYVSGAIIGGIAGTVATTGTLEKVMFEGGIYVATTANAVTVGGIAGINNGNLKGVTAIANIEVENNGAIVGGIVGKNATGATVTLATGGAINTAFVEVIVTGDATTKSDSVVGENAGTVDNTEYLSKGAMVDNGTAKTIATTSIATSAMGKTYAQLASGTNKVFANSNLLNVINAYRNDYNLTLTAVYTLKVSNLREYELIGQYNFLDVQLTDNITFHKNFVNTPFNGARIGNLDLNAKTIDGGNITAINMYVFA